MERGGGGGEIRQRMTLLDQLSLFQHQPSSNLRDLLKVRDDAGRDPRASPAVTLAAVLASDKNSPSAAGAAAPSSARTLLDVIRDEESRDAAADAAGSSSWRELTDRLRIRHAAAAASWTAGSASSAAEAPTPAATTSTIRVSLMTLMELREREEEERGGGEEEPPVAVADVEAEEEEDDVAEEARRRDVCCVCMVRKKGAAFIPCGHTFCRLCSREMLAGRGSCPLCNAAIAEVLHIF